MTKLWISAGLKVNPGKSASYVKDALIILQQQTCLEEGCIYFDVLHNIEDPSKFTLWEEWINEAALAEHFAKDHTKAYIKQGLTEVLYVEKLEKLS